MERRQVVITGAQGFIGLHLTEAMSRLGWSVFAVDRRPPADSTRRQRVVTHRLEVCSAEFVRLVKAIRPTAVVHLAAQSSLSAMDADPSQGIRDNILATVNVVDACLAARVSRLVFASSAAVYGSAPDLPVREDANLRPTSAYGWSKAASEQLIVRAAAANGSPNYSILRFANVYGPGQEAKDEPGVIVRWFEAASAGQELVVNGSGTPTRDFIYVEDVVEAIALSTAHGDHAILNISTGHETSLADLATAVKRLAGMPLAWRSQPGHAGEISRSVLDPARARQVLGWKAVTPLELGLKRTWSYLAAGSQAAQVAAVNG